MSGEGMIASGGRADIVQCFTCSDMVQDVPDGALPGGWDALREPGYSPAFFCASCIVRGSMEHYRARLGLPRRERWRFQGGVMALYRPAARQLLIATPDGMAEISEREAEQLHAAIGAALATRELADQLMAEVKR
ncbi:hypothetical protein FIV32_02260 [Sphingomonadales bacterium 58]|uniref:hypothetical protein n=1 Tax=Sphingobium sp. S8 TaxID=2758385 RepID=UPI001917AB21|nr:hypothetical protein [Sphingobium sp. S8]MBY2957573.1 hypothetical protein [Sphingomonadales bacterium 58]